MSDEQEQLVGRERQAADGIDFIEADINEGYRNVLLPYLMKRERMA